MGGGGIVDLCVCQDENNWCLCDFKNVFIRMSVAGPYVKRVTLGVSVRTAFCRVFV